ncbi:heme/hemin ABC transporter substrate-binding protein [Rufibacter aurantiacus]|uniref:heme/hemin ABC transporter substrate-binding protein n=1 Tax=Rufibacter aurantiacus TaxID=2817374 RepID=UPI001B309B62|nr:ABC transporter substrate-binding protein [Rufibacter aurantiacus]
MRKYLILASASLALLSCERFQNKDQKQENTERIVSVSKQHTEIMYALGAEQNLVAVDVSSTYPEAAKKLPTVGYHRALSLEGLVAAKPTMIIHDGPASIGPEHVVRQLEQLKIPMKQFPVNGTTLDSTKLLFKEMGQYFHREKQADSLAQKLDREMQQALENAKNYPNKPKVLIIHYGQANNVYLVMTGKSTGAKMVSWAGGTMAVEGEKGMKQLSAEVVAQSDPDVILLTDFGYDKLGSKQKISELPGVSTTKAFRNNRIYRVEEHDLVYLGPRTGQNVLALQKLIHQNGQVQ